VAVLAALLALALVGGAVGLIVSSGSGPGAEPAHPNALPSQAKELSAPLLLFDRSTTPRERALTRAAPSAVTRHVNACQKPYQRQLLHPVAGGDRYKLYLLYVHGIVLETHQRQMAPVAPELRVAARAWADMRLGNATLQRFAHGLSTEILAALNRPRFHACAFVQAIAANGYSLAWARQSGYGRSAAGYWTELRDAGQKTAQFWRYVRSRGIRQRRLWTPAELRDLAGVPGEIR
jgi:hypothetical protein